MPTLGFADPGSAGDDQAYAAELREEGAVREEVNAALLNILPWGVSAVFHAGLVLLAIFVVWSTIATATDEEVTVPLVTLGETPGAPLQVTEVERVQTDPQTQRTVQPTQTRSAAPTEMKVKVPKLIGVSGATGAKGINFGSAIDVGSGFKATFFGSSGNARRIVFLVDASGSLLDTFPYVIKELKETIQQLSEQQQFTVIFFTADGPVEAVRPGLKPANAQNKSVVIDWIDDNNNVKPALTAEPIEALRRGLSYRPELVFLLSDNITGRGQYEIDQTNLLAEIERANSSHTKINTIQFVYRDPLERAGVKGTMELIADQSGGVFKFVDDRELKIR